MNIIKLKMIISILCIVVSIPTICFANYFDNNPKRYFNYYNSEQYSAYADLDSVSVVRYNPPYYVIDITEYAIDYVNQVTMAVLLRFYYNYDKQTMRFTLIKAAPASAEDGTSKLDITPSLSNIETINNLPVIEKYSGNYLLGETAFFKAYHMFFTKEYNTPKGWQ